MTVALAVAFLTILCLLSALLTAMETAILSIRDHEREALAERARTDVEARALELLKNGPGRPFEQILVVGSVTNLMLAVIVLIIVRESPLGMKVVPAAAAVFAVVLLFTEVLPKALALHRPRSVFFATAPLLLLGHEVLSESSRRLLQACDRVVAALTPSELQPNPSLTEEELDTLVEMRQEEGALTMEESEVIREILRLGNRTAKDCMTPRTDACVLPDNLAPEAADSAIRGQDHWNVPVFHGQPDSIVGMLDVRAYLNDDSGTRHYMRHLQPPVFVPESMNALRLFNDHLTDPFSAVVVLDEYGGFEGVVTAADMLEELIADAAPSSLAEVEIQEVGSGRYIVSGSARLDELGEVLDANLEHGELDTIGGLIFTLAGEVPQRGTEVRLAEGISAVVRKSTKTRVLEVLVEQRSRGGDAGEEAA